MPGPAPSATTSGASASSARFFGWIRSLGIIRQNGWMGGVCGGVAARLGIDPIIMRGIAVVVAVLGGPAFLLYAAAWLLLPDSSGDIHLERLIRGHFEPAMIGIIVLALFSFLPFAQGFWWAGAQFWGGLSWLASAGRVLWALLVIGLIVAFVIWAARSGRIPPAQPATSAGPTYPPAPTPSTTTSPTDAGGGAAHSASASAAPASTLPGPTTDAGESDAPGSGSGSGQPTSDQDDVADWRARQDAWRAEYAAWNAQQAADARAIKQQRSAEIRAQAQTLAVESELARRRRKAANPRTSAAYVGIALGLALVLGGIASAIALGSLAEPYALTIGLAVATAVVGASMVLAGALRRRSGFLGFVSILLIVGTLCTALPPRGHAVVWPYVSYGNSRTVSIYQPVGHVELSYPDDSQGHTADVVQNAGSVSIWLDTKADASIDVIQHASGSTVNVVKPNGETSSTSLSAGEPDSHLYSFGNGSPTVKVHIDQGAGAVTIYQVDGFHE